MINAIQKYVLNARNIRKAVLGGLAAIATGLTLMAQATPAHAALTWYGVDMPWIGYGYGFGSSYNATTVGTELSAIKANHMNCVRIWVCEGLDGLSFNSSGACTGISSTNLANVKNFCSQATSKGLTCIVVFINYMDVQNHPTYITNSTNRTALIDNGLVPLAKAINGYSVAFDLVNEGNIATNAVSWSNLRTFLSAAVTGLRNNGISKWVTMSDQNPTDYTSNLGSTVGGLGFNFYDFHSYNTAGTTAVSSSNVGGVPLVMSEYGPSSAWPNQSLSSNEDTIWNMVHADINQGYYGTLAWCYLQDGSNWGLQGRSEFSYMGALGQQLGF